MPSRLRSKQFSWPRRHRRRLERPETSFFCTKAAARFRTVRGSRRRRARPRRPHLDPSGNVRDRTVGQLALGRHLYDVAVPDGTDDQAVIRLARHQRRPAVASFQQRVARIDPQVAALLLGTVTLTALVDQNGAYPRLVSLDERPLASPGDQRAANRSIGRHGPLACRTRRLGVGRCCRTGELLLPVGVRDLAHNLAQGMSVKRFVSLRPTSRLSPALREAPHLF